MFYIAQYEGIALNIKLNPLLTQTLVLDEVLVEYTKEKVLELSMLVMKKL